MIDQVTIFIENAEGRLSALCHEIADAGINMYALTIADTADYGLVRVICSDPDDCVARLRDKDYRVSKTPVLAVTVPSEPGGLARLMDTFDQVKLNIEYGYCFAFGESAVSVFKVERIEDQQAVRAALEAAGYAVLSQESL